MPFLQGNPIAAERVWCFRLVKTDGSLVNGSPAPLSGQTFASPQIQISKAGGALVDAAGIGSVPELGTTGLYTLTLSAAELDTPGPILLRVNKTGAFVIEDPSIVERAIFGSVVAGTLTATAFTTDLASAVNGAHNDSLIQFRTGTLAGQVKKVGTYTDAAATKLITLATINAVPQTFTGAPSIGNVFKIINE